MGPDLNVTARPAAHRRAALALVAGLLVWAPAPAPGAAARATRSTADYRLPDVTLVDQAGARVRLAEALGAAGPVLLQFIFTTCSTICPVLSGTFAAVQERLPDARLVSISIDPEVDTPARLQEYARRFQAGPRWRLLGGRLEDVIAVERAFDAYRGNKMRHEPLTFVRAGPRRPWLRLEGMLSAAELAAEVRQAAAADTDAVAPPPATAAGQVPPAAAAGQAPAAPPSAPGQAPAATPAAAAEVAVAGGLPGGAGVVAAPTTAVERGRRIYRDGVLPSGRPLRGITQGDVPVAGAQLACAGCHRPSGYGGVEGGTLVPPVTGPALFSGAPAPAAELLGKLYQEELSETSWTRLRAAREHPPYTAASLGAALRRGVDPDGRPLDPLMPRYQLAEPDLADLTAFLRTLSAAPAPAPGVEAATIHFAVVVAPDADAARRRAMLDVAAAFCRHRNAEKRHLLDRPAASPGMRSSLRQAWREWVLHVWQLEGPPASWAAQLVRHYGEQPVFALLSGLGAAEWRPVHEFCERAAVPCVFPNVDLPVTAPTGAWTLYLSAGLALEARALGPPLAAPAAAAPVAADPAAGNGPLTVVQLFRDRPSGLVPAAALREQLQGEPRVHLADLPLGAAGPAAAAAEVKQLLAGRLPSAPRGPAALVLWLDGADLAALAPVLAAAGGAAAPRIYLSYSLLGEEPPALPPAFRERIFLTFRYALPGDPAPQAWRARAWLRARGVASGHERIQLDTLFTLAAADDALDRMAGRFSREYFVEVLERETERAANPGVYPRLGLGAGQRFASQGCYIVRPAAGALGGLTAASGWIVP